MKYLNFKKIFKALGKSPSHYWSWFLVFLLLLFALVLASGLYKFKKISQSLEKPLFIELETKIKIPNRVILEKTVEVIKKKEEDFEKAKTIQPTQNP